MTKPEVIVQDGYRGSRSTMPEEVRAEVLAEVERGTGRNEIARRLGLSTGIVSRIAAAAGLGFSETIAAKATRVRMVQLQAKRLDQAEQLHVTLDATLALAQDQMLSAPADHRGRSEAVRAVRDLAAAYRDLVAIDADALAKTAGLEDAGAFLDQIEIAIRQTVGEIEAGIEPPPGDCLGL
jgi:hypothetical protein